MLASTVGFRYVTVTDSEAGDSNFLTFGPSL